MENLCYWTEMDKDSHQRINTVTELTGSVVNTKSKDVLPELLQMEFMLKIGDVSIIIHLKILRMKI